MKGVLFIPLVAHADSRGTLIAPGSDLLPFEVKNFFYIFGVPPHQSRGDHSSCSDEALMVVQGALEVDLDNGEEQGGFLLRPAKEVLCVHAGVYLRLHSFAAGTILFVMASTPYNRGSRWGLPQPQLLENGWEANRQ